MIKEKTLTIELSHENPLGDGYFYAMLDLPAEEYEIRDAIQRARMIGREESFRSIGILDCGAWPELLYYRLDSPSIDELNFFAKLSDYCVLTNMDDNGYDFYISVTADKYEFDNLYNSDVTGIDFMEKFQFEKIIIPERTYAVFETEKQKMPISEYFDIRKQIAAEWLSNEEYQMINAPELAVYHWGIVGGYTDRTIEIWIPIEKK